MTEIQDIELTDALLLEALHGTGFEKSWTASSFLSLLSTPGCFGLLAADDEPKGFILCRAAADEAEILTLVVDESVRRQGVASSLLQAAEEKVPGKKFFLEVAEQNVAARAFYAARGFTEVGRRPDYYGKGQDALLMTKDA